MKLTTITIDNYRSIRHESFDIVEIGGSKTYTLIGINESGKSSFLSAVASVDDDMSLHPRDFFDPKLPVRVALKYQLEIDDRKNLKRDLLGKGLPKDLVAKIDARTVDVCVTFAPGSGSKGNVEDQIEFITPSFEQFTLKENQVVEKSAEDEPDLDLQEYFRIAFPQHFWGQSHFVSLWRSESRFLISGPIDLDRFSEKPADVSVPLRNCFALAGISEDDIANEIARAKADPAHNKNLQQRLEDRVTAHVKKIWPNHPIEIKFQIDTASLSFLVEDVGVRYNAKTTEQRSDGFKQFVSFLLTISAEHNTKNLSNTLLLIDEPETHLHPQAQEHLLRELIRITSGRDNNLVIFATHSNYMIDKEHIDRCFRVEKVQNRETSITQIPQRDTSYSEVNFEVFHIATADYHNELYGYLEDIEPVKLNALPKSRTWDNAKTGQRESVSLPKYIRHSIHHPENTRNPKFSADDLRSSITLMRELKYGSGKKRLRVRSGDKPSVTAKTLVGR
jgi:energy-coupling factor transporter ATP-binding protein EcfA2